MKYFARTFAALVLISLSTKLPAQIPSALEQYERYIRQRATTPTYTGTEKYQTPPIYTMDTTALQMQPPQLPEEIAPPETLPYFDEPVIVAGETVQVIRKAAPRTLKIYGSDFFQNTPEIFIAQQPVSEKYVLGSGDQLMLNLWGGVSAQYQLTVDREGKIYIPQVGDVAVAGLSLSQAEKQVKKALEAAYSDFNANLSVAAVKAIRVFVVGQVKYPGVYDLPGLSRVMTALAAAGGPDSTGSFRNISIFRNEKKVAQLDIYKFIKMGHSSGNIQLASGDVIAVPNYQIRVKARGRVKTPAIYELLPGETISDLLEYAGGTSADANIDAIFIDRVQNGVHSAISINLKDSAQAKTKMHDGDDISVFSANPYRKNAVFLEGYVPQPGAYGWYDSMRVSDLFRGVGMLFEDTYTKRANLLRLMPNGKRKIIAVALDDAIAGEPEADILLMPQDIITVFSKDMFREKKYVRIKGAVRKPGKYELYKDMKISDLIFTANGLEEYAYMDSAEVVRITNGRNVQKYNVPLKKILHSPGCPEDMFLQDEDYVFIRSIPEWRGTWMVTILGEVQFPGTYAMISEDEKLSELFERAGGVTEKAFLEGALFIRPGISKRLSRRNIMRVVRSTQEFTRDSLGQIDTTLLIFNWNPVDLNRVIIDMNQVLAGKSDIKLEPGDTVFVPRRPDGVSVIGAVASNGTVKYIKGKNVKFYIERAGGLTRNADDNEIRLVKPNGKVLKVSMRYGKISPGDAIIVPQHIKKEGRIISTIRDVVSILSGVATTIYILMKL